MPAYVDEPKWQRWHGLSGHLIADTPEELASIAATLSLSDKFFMKHAPIPHYQLPAGQRCAAINAGAVALDRDKFMAQGRRISQYAERFRGKPVPRSAKASTPSQGSIF